MNKVWIVYPTTGSLQHPPYQYESYANAYLAAKELIRNRPEISLAIYESVRFLTGDVRVRESKPGG